MSDHTQFSASGLKKGLSYVVFIICPGLIENSWRRLNGWLIVKTI